MTTLCSRRSRKGVENVTADRRCGLEQQHRPEQLSGRQEGIAADRI